MSSQLISEIMSCLLMPSVSMFGKNVCGSLFCFIFVFVVSYLLVCGCCGFCGFLWLVWVWLEFGLGFFWVWFGFGLSLVFGLVWLRFGLV